MKLLLPGMKQNETEIKKEIRPRNKPGCKPGPRPYRWKNSRYVDKDGYIWIRMRNHPFCNSHGRVPEHRLMAESVLGRYLKKNETVHHWDNDHSHNKNSNFLICSVEYHGFIHWRMECAGLLPLRNLKGRKKISPMKLEAI